MVNNWQALVVVKTLKIYLGTFVDEKEAAVMYDFYSILGHRDSAKVNFDYTYREILAMMDSFLAQGKVFDPRPFLKP